MLYTAFAAAAVDALLADGVGRTPRPRRRSRDAALRAKYLRIVMLYLLAGEGPAPRFPMIRRAGARLLLVETVAGLAGVTYGLTPRPCGASSRSTDSTPGCPPHGSARLGYRRGALPAAALSPARRRSRGELRSGVMREPQPLCVSRP